MSVTAIVGAGGKTTLMFDLARAEKSPAVVSTTTKVAAEQTLSADARFTLSDLLTRDAGSLPPVSWVSPSLEPVKGKILGLDASQSERLIRFCQKNDLPLFLEADGAARKHLKAPAPHEPVIPPESDQVLWLGGVDLLRKPLTEDNVFRSEIFSALTGTALGTPITAGSFRRLLTACEGAFKESPPQAERIAVLTHAEGHAAFSAAREISQLLALPNAPFSALWLTTLAEDGHTKILKKWKIKHS